MQLERISGKAMAIWELLWAFVTVLLFLLGIVLLRPYTWLWYTVLWTLGAIWVLGAFLYIPLYYFGMEYGVDDDVIVYRKGVFFPNTQILYRDRIAFVSVYRNPLTPLFGMATLVVSAAGGRIRILFLNVDRAEELAYLLTQTANMSSGGQAG